MPIDPLFSEFAPDPNYSDDPRLNEFVNLFTELQQLESPGFAVEVPQTSTFEEALERGSEIGAPGFISAGAGVASSIVQIGRGLAEQLGIDIGDSEEFVQPGPGGIGPEAGSEPLDITDPRVVLDEKSFNALSPAQKKLRLMRNFIKSAERGTVIAPLIKGEPLTDVGAEAQGTLAPPMNFEEQAMRFIGENFVGGIIPGALAFKPAQLAGRAALRTAVGRSALNRATARVAGQTGGRVSQALTKPIRAIATSSEASEQAGRVALREGLERFGADIFGETTSGAALGGGFAARAAAETGRDIDFKTFAIGALMGGGAGAVLGTGFRAFDARDVRTAAKSLDNLAREADIEFPVGTTVTDVDGTPKRLSHYDSNGRARWQDPETGNFTSAPDEEVMQQQAVRLVGEALEAQRGKGPSANREAEIAERLQRLDAQTEANVRNIEQMDAPDEMKQQAIERVRAMREAAAEKIRTGEDVDVMLGEARGSIEDPISGSPEQLRNSLASIARAAGIESSEQAEQLLKDAVYVQSKYENGQYGAKHLHSSMAPDAYQRQIEILRSRARSPSEDISYGERVEALGRALAMEDVARARSPNAPDQLSEGPGIEMLARKWAQLGDVEFRRREQWLLGKEAQEGENAVTSRRILERMRELREEPGTVQRAQAEIREFINLEKKRFNRGAMAGQQVRLVDRNGVVARLLEDPSLGFAMAEMPGGEQIRVDLSNAEIIPQPGQYVEFADGSVGKAKQLPDQGSVIVERPDGTRQEFTPGDIERVSGTPEDLADLRETFSERGGAIYDDNRAVEPIQPIQTTIRDSGERVEVLSVTDEMARVRHLETGEVDEFRLDQLTGGSRQTDGFLTESGELPIFEPGTLPSGDGSNINYLMLTEEEANVFENMLRAGVMDLGTLLSEGLNRPANLHLFPQPPRPGTKLYAVELPSEVRSPTKAAKRALGVLGGNVDVDNFNTQTLQARMRFDPSKGPINRTTARVYEVPEGLRAKVREASQLKSMPKEQRLDYLKKLTDLGFEADTKRTRFVVEAADARERAAQALRDGNVEVAHLAEVEAADKASRAGLRTVEVEDNLMGQQLDQMMENLWGRMTPESQQMLSAIREESEGAFVEALRRHPPSRQGELPTDPIVLQHPDHPGMRMIIHKERIPSFRRTGGEELPENFENLSPEQISETGNIQEGFRDVIHWEVFDAAGQRLEGGTIGSEQRTVSVPRSAAENSQAAIDQAIAEGRSVDDVLRQAEEARQEIEVADFNVGRRGPGDESSVTEKVAVLDEFETTVPDPEGGEPVQRTVATIRREDGSVVQVEASELSRRRTELEDNVKVRIPRRLTEDEVLRETWIRARKFDRNVVRYYSAGEWRHQIPGVYATIRQSGDNVRLRIFQEPQSPRSLRDKRSIPLHERDFPTREAAESFLRDSEGFRRATPDATRSSEIDGPGAKVLDHIEDFELFESKLQAAEAKAERAVLGEEMTAAQLKESGGLEGREAEFREAFRQAAAEEGIVTTRGEPYKRAQDIYRRHTNLQRRMNEVAEEAGLEPEDIAALRFGDSKIEVTPKEKFEKFPDVETLTADQMRNLERDLIDVIDTYRTLHNNWMPSPVRDYAARFARRWNALGLEIHNKNGRVMPLTRSQRRLVGTMYADGSRVIDPATGKAVMQEASEVFRAGQFSKGVGSRPTRTSVDVDVRSTEGGVELVANVPTAPGAPDLQPMEGVLLNRMRPGEQAVSEEVINLWKAVENNRRFYDIQQTFSSRPDEILTRNLARVGDDQRLAVITDPNVGGPDAEVMFVEGPDLHFERMDKADIQRIRDPRLENDFMKMVDQATYRDRQIPRSRDKGFGDIERDLGLTGIDPTSERFDERYLEEFQNVLDRIQFFPEDGNLRGDPDDLNLMADMYMRAHEIGIKVPTDQVKGPLRDMLDRMGIERTANQYGPDNPFGVFVGKVKMNKITPKQRDLLHQHARRFGLTVKDLPDWRLAEGLVERAYDPITARRLWQWRNDLGFLRFSESQDFPTDLGTITFSTIQGPGAGDIGGLGQMFAFPRTMARRHPTFDMAYQRHAQLIIEENNANREVLSRFSELQEEYGADDLRDIRELMQDERLIPLMDHPADTPTWQQVKEAVPEADDDLRFGYEEVRSIVTEMLRKEKEVVMRKGWEIRPLDVNNQNDLQIAGERYGIDPDQIKAIKDGKVEPPMIVDRKLTAENRRSPDEVREMLDLLDEYASVDDIPEDVSENLPEWMIREFEFFKNFGINNYWPRIQQGRNVISRVLEDGSEELVGFAPSGIEAQRLVQRAIEEGRLTPDNYNVRIRGHNMDDIDLHYLGPKRLNKVLRLIDENANDVLRAAGITGEPIAPRLPHTEMRSANLTSLIDDPIRELQVYVSRVNRNKYLMDVHDAYQNALEMDETLARSFGIDPLQSGSYNRLHKEFVYQRDRAMGEQTDLERYLDQLVAWGEAKKHGARKAWNSLKQKISDNQDNPDFNVYGEDEAYQIYFKRFGARRLAQRTVAVQAVLRLGLNIGSALINSSQTLMATLPKMVQHTGSHAGGVKATMQGFSDMIHYFRTVTNRPRLQATTELGEELVEFSESLGLSTITNRAEAGGTGVGVLDGSRRPVYYVDDTWGEKFEKFSKFWGMYFFDKAERINRLSTAFATRRAAQQMGLEEAAARPFARRIMEETQFQYYDEALPRVMRGPLGRVAFQFKPFVANMLKYNLDLMKQAARGDTNAAKALMWHAGVGSALGGAAYLTDNPITAPINAALGAMGKPTLPEMLMGDDAKEHYAERPESWDHPMWQMDQLMEHGLPGLLGISVGSRLSVGGQDLDPRRWQDLLLGPHFSVYQQYLAALGVPIVGSDAGFLQEKGGGTAAIAGAAGGEFLRRKVPVLRHMPFGSILSNYMATSVASQFTHNSFNQFMQDHIEGQRFAREITPTLARGIDFTVEMFHDGELFGMLGNEFASGQTVSGGQLQMIPPGPSRLHESTAALFGFMTTRKANENALLGAWTADQRRNRATRATALEGMARALAAGDVQEMYELQEKAMDRGVMVHERDILQAAKRMTEGRLSQALERFMLRHRVNQIGVGPDVDVETEE